MVAIRKPIFIQPLDLGDLAAGSVLPGHPAFNLTRPDSVGLTWKAGGTGDTWVRGRFQDPRLVDFCAIVAATALPGTSYRLRLGATQADVDGNAAPYDSGLLPFITPAAVRASGLYHSHLELPDAVEALWWRIDIVGHVGLFEAASIVLGKAIVPSRYYDKDFERGLEDMGSLDINRFGVADDVPGVKLRTLMFTLPWLSEAEYEDTFAPLAEEIGTTQVLYCCFDPAETPWRQARTYLGWLTRAPFARGGTKPRTFSMQLQIRSLI